MTDRTAPTRSLSGWTILGEGFGAVVRRSPDGRCIAWVARTPSAGRSVARQVAWLPHLAPALPLPIPAIRWHALPDTDARMPHGALVYDAIPGRPLTAHDISLEVEDQIVAFLVALHRARMPPGANLAGWHDALVAARDARYAAIRETLRRRLSPREDRAIAAWHCIEPPATAHPAVLHGDFWIENLLIDPGSGLLAGVIDWEAISIGHPAQDLVPLRYPRRDAADRIAVAYAAHTGRDLASLTRDMTWFWEARDFGGIASAIEMGDEEELDDGIRKLRDGPILRR